MSEPALSRMSLGDFLIWEDGTDTRYELIGGFVVAMAPPAPAHGVLGARVTARLEAELASRRPCRTQIEAGIIRPDRADTFLVADIAVTCAAFDRTQHAIQDPILIVEILSPSTESHDRWVKLPIYRTIESVQEILLVGSEGRRAELHRRHGDVWITEIFPGGDKPIVLESVGTEISIADLYDGIIFDDELVG